ncbi:cilia- and flagella-associated protein 251-like [Apis cerana]|uniref:cilia- and flagella-associated protein 251-like n=1 Tax=Apis cerana TaxID=7461 RepID=UPI0007E2B6D9|nr:cilia- and flagella-associated protein 251-like [Apis cerana]
MFSRATFLACVFLLCSRQSGAATEQRMTTLVNKMIAEDLDRSATTRYVYNQQQGLPVYYVRYTNHGSGRYYHAPAAVQYVVEAATPVAHDVTETNPLLHPYAIANGVPSYQGIANYGNEQSLERRVAGDLYHVDGKITLNERDDAEEEEEEEGNEEKDEEEDDSVDDEEIHDGSGGSVKLFGGYEDEEVGEISSGDESGSFETGKRERCSEHGEKGEKGYEAWKEFSKGGRGSNNDEHREGYYKNRSEDKKGHVDEAENHGSHEKAGKGKKGKNYGHSSYHKKGHKTNGFHNVYHKDEYKKETDFYDDDHKKGDFGEYEEFDKGYKIDEGGFKKEGHHSFENDYQNRGKKGHYDKGHHVIEDQGHQAEESEKSHYEEHEDYNVAKDSKSDKAHEFNRKNR